MIFAFIRIIFLKIRFLILLIKVYKISLKTFENNGFDDIALS